MKLRCRNPHPAQGLLADIHHCRHRPAYEVLAPPGFRDMPCNHLGVDKAAFPLPAGRRVLDNMHDLKVQALLERIEFLAECCALPSLIA